MIKSYGINYSVVSSYTMSYPMSWFHEDPEHTLDKQVNQSENNCLVNIYNLSYTQCYYLEQNYNIHTIADLVDYIIHNGFPRDIDFDKRTIIVLSVRVANKLLVKQ